MKVNAKRPHKFQVVPSYTPGVHAVAASSNRSLSRHSHLEFGIGVIDAGAQASHSGVGKVEAGPGDVITVNPGEVHDGQPKTDAGRTWRIIYINPDVVLEAWSTIRCRSGHDFEFARPVFSGAFHMCYANELFKAATSRESYHEFESSLLFLLDFLGNFSKRSPVRMDHEVAKARAMIDEDPSVTITLDDLSNEARADKFSLLRSFTRDMGLTPHNYIIQRRIERARTLIDDGMSLALAAVESGFCDQSHMSRCFTTRYGLTPKAYAQMKS